MIAATARGSTVSQRVAVGHELERKRGDRGDRAGSTVPSPLALVASVAPCRGGGTAGHRAAPRISAHRRCRSSANSATWFSAKVVDRLREQTAYNPRKRKATALCVLLIVVQAYLLGQAMSFARLRELFVARFGAIRPRAFQLRFKSAEAVAFFRAALAEAIAAVVSAAGVRLEGALASFADVRVYDGTAMRVPMRGKRLTKRSK